MKKLAIKQNTYNFLLSVILMQHIISNLLIKNDFKKINVLDFGLKVYMRNNYFNSLT